MGQYALQVLKYYGYQNLLATASPGHHEHLTKLGAAKCFDYRDAGVVRAILNESPNIPFIIDCIGSQRGTLQPISEIAGAGSKVAIMLPVILKNATKDEAPEYGMEVGSVVEWASGVEPRGVRTQFYLEVRICWSHKH